MSSMLSTHGVKTRLDLFALMRINFFFVIYPYNMIRVLLLLFEENIYHDYSMEHGLLKINFSKACMEVIAKKYLEVYFLCDILYYYQTSILSGRFSIFRSPYKTLVRARHQFFDFFFDILLRYFFTPTEHKQRELQLASCRFCFENPKITKHLIIAIGKKVLILLFQFFFSII